MAKNHKKVQEIIREAINKESYEYLGDYQLIFFDMVNEAVLQGETPENIGRMVRNYLGPERFPMALRCEQAAAHAISLQVE